MTDRACQTKTARNWHDN